MILKSAVGLQVSAKQIRTLLNTLLELPLTTKDVTVEVIFPNIRDELYDDRLAHRDLEESWTAVDLMLSSRDGLRFGFCVRDTDNLRTNWDFEYLPVGNGYLAGLSMSHRL